MISGIPVDDSLVDTACKLGNHSSRQEAIEAALREYVQRHRQQQIVQLFGTVEFDDSYDYKQSRTRTSPHRGRK